jgi:hypothetical protein
MLSPIFTILEGFTELSLIFTLPALQAVVAWLLVLNILTAQSHLSIRTPSSIIYFCLK